MESQRRPFDAARRKHCDALLDNPLLQTPPDLEAGSEPIKPKRKQSWICPPKFALLTDEFYRSWCKHRYEVHIKQHAIDSSSPVLLAEEFLKRSLLNHYASILQENILQNTELIKRINVIQRHGAAVDCWNKHQDDTHHKRLFDERQKILKEKEDENRLIYQRLKETGSFLASCKELDKEWAKLKKKIILGCKQPFILDGTRIDRGMEEPAFEKQNPSFSRDKVRLTITVPPAAKVGTVTIELFSDIVPRTCELFLSLVKGDADGHAYGGTRIFRIVPGLYCRGGDVATDTGFGEYLPGQESMAKPENYTLPHSMPGVVSMVVTADEKVYNGEFNIVFKPLPQFDGQHVVFGRIIRGPPDFCEALSVRGRPLGSTRCDVTIAKCEYITKRGKRKVGMTSKINYNHERRSQI